MDEREKTLLLELILLDIRMGWGPGRVSSWSLYNKIRCYFYCRRRIRRARQLAKELLLFAHIGRLALFNPGDDGRWFRAHYDEGGYEGMELLHHWPFIIEQWREGMQDTRYKIEGLSAAFIREAKQLLKKPWDWYFCENEPS